MQKTHVQSNQNANLLDTSALREKVNASGRTTKSRLLGLSKQLSDWNIARGLSNTSHEKLPDLSIDDVHFLKEIIHAEIEKSSAKHPDVVSDQILFLIIGAIQIQTQNHSDSAWKLVNQSIQNFLKPEKEKRTLLLSFAVTALVVICVSATMLLNQNLTKIEMASAINTAPIMGDVGVAGPATLSALLTIYGKMKDGTCQLPQAAMLPPNQRQAFLSFINDGIVDIDNVENLKSALSYVNCLYPQKLMTAPL